MLRRERIFLDPIRPDRLIPAVVSLNPYLPTASVLLSLPPRPTSRPLLPSNIIRPSTIPTLKTERIQPRDSTAGIYVLPHRVSIQERRAGQLIRTRRRRIRMGNTSLSPRTAKDLDCRIRSRMARIRISSSSSSKARRRTIRDSQAGIRDIRLRNRRYRSSPLLPSLSMQSIPLPSPFRTPLPSYHPHHRHLSNRIIPPLNPIPNPFRRPSRLNSGRVKPPSPRPPSQQVQQDPTPPRPLPRRPIEEGTSCDSPKEVSRTATVVDHLPARLDPPDQLQHPALPPRRIYGIPPRGTEGVRRLLDRCRQRR